MDRVQHRHRAGVTQRMVGAIEHGHVVLQEAAPRVVELDPASYLARWCLLDKLPCAGR